MTDRVNALIVVLDDDYRTDDVEAIINMIQMIKGVALVEKQIMAGEDYAHRARIAYTLQPQIMKAIQEVFDPKRKL
jgi:hypothetical protein